MKTPNLPDVSFGKIGELPEVEEEEELDEDQEEEQATPPDVVEVLGFDPKEDANGEVDEGE